MKFKMLKPKVNSNKNAWKIEINMSKLSRKTHAY